jgi:hypothetical protein
MHHTYHKQMRTAAHVAIFHEMAPNPSKPIKLNGVFFTLCAILHFVVASDAKAKLSTLFLNCKQAKIF